MEDVRILFKFYSDALEDWTVESLWARVFDKQNGYYIINNIPFYAPFSFGDIVSAAYDQNEEMLTYQKTIKYSGNSTIQIVMMKKDVHINEIREIFNQLSCETEKFSAGYFVINVPNGVNYKAIKVKLTELEDQEVIAYAESCLDDQHNTQTS